MLQIIESLNEFNQLASPSVVSIGNFDGVHLGHQQVVRSIVEHSHKLGAISTVMTFEPLFKEYFNPHSVARLTSIEQRARLLTELGVERVVCVNLNKAFIEMLPEQFIQHVLIDSLGVKYLSVGDDFRFGYQRKGDFSLLSEYGGQAGFAVVSHDTCEYQGTRISSGWIREVLAQGNFELAAKLLGRAFSIAGNVSSGAKLGRTLGFPTANIKLNSHTKCALHGVYTASVQLQNKQVHPAVVNIGQRPTVDGHKSLLEAHLLDFDENLYNQSIEVIFHSKLRNEKAFDGLEQLKAQIELDVQQARQFFATKP